MKKPHQWKKEECQCDICQAQISEKKAKKHPWLDLFKVVVTGIKDLRIK